MTPLSYADLADRLGVTIASLHTYRARGDLPNPDGHLGRTPYWWPTTIDKWVANRPGKAWKRGKAQPPEDTTVTL